MAPGEPTSKPPDGIARSKKAKPSADRDAAPKAAVPPPSPSSASRPRTAERSIANAVPVAGDDPTVIPVKHCHRLVEGELLATSSRIEWAILLKRTYGVDALRCPNSEAKLGVLAIIPSKDAIGAILTHVGVRTEPVPRERARDPTGQTSFDVDAAGDERRRHSVGRVQGRGVPAGQRGRRRVTPQPLEQRRTTAIGSRDGRGHGEGATMFYPPIRRSKTDQEGVGRTVGVPYGSSPATCPVRALRAWLVRRGAAEGPLFVSARRKRLDGRDVARIVKRRAAAAGVDARELAGHSLRRGGATAAARAGKTGTTIMRQTGHKSVAMVRKYITEAKRWKDNAATGIGL